VGGGNGKKTTSWALHGNSVMSIGKSQTVFLPLIYVNAIIDTYVFKSLVKNPSRRMNKLDVFALP
jgi:hypothetical protein